MGYQLSPLQERYRIVCKKGYHQHEEEGPVPNYDYNYYRRDCTADAPPYQNKGNEATLVL
jgi:hypothetical protein